MSQYLTLVLSAGINLYDVRNSFIPISLAQIRYQWEQCSVRSQLHLSYYFNIINRDNSIDGS
jgi:hypothetical protein